jgi:hypothetical protein
MWAEQKGFGNQENFDSWDWMVKPGTFIHRTETNTKFCGTQCAFRWKLNASAKEKWGNDGSAKCLAALLRFIAAHMFCGIETSFLEASSSGRDKRPIFVRKQSLGLRPWSGKRQFSCQRHTSLCGHFSGKLAFILWWFLGGGFVASHYPIFSLPGSPNKRFFTHIPPITYCDS